MTVQNEIDIFLSPESLKRSIKMTSHWSEINAYLNDLCLAKKGWISVLNGWSNPELGIGVRKVFSHYRLRYDY